MDPNANLKEQLELAKHFLEKEEIDCEDIDDVQRLAELVIALDGWISGGGFNPERWQRTIQVLTIKV